MIVKEYLERTYNPSNPSTVRRRITCADGYSVSVQGGTSYCYCTPHEHCNVYETVEVGFPSSLDEKLAAYAEAANTTETVFMNVPISVVEDLVVKHGGII